MAIKSSPSKNPTDGFGRANRGSCPKAFTGCLYPLTLFNPNKMNNELTPHIEYYDEWNGNVSIKGQLNSKGQEEGLWEWFYPNGNIEWRISYVEGEEDGIEEWFDEQGNIIRTRHWKDGKLIETIKHCPF